MLQSMCRLFLPEFRLASHTCRLLFCALLTAWLATATLVEAAEQSVAAGSHHSLVINTDGTLQTWGRNEYGQLGLGDTTNRDTPTLVGSV